MYQVTSYFFWVVALGCFFSFGAGEEYFSPAYSGIQHHFKHRKWTRPSNHIEHAEASSALYQSDDILTYENSPTPLGSAIKNEGYRWPGFPGDGTIPYVIDSTLDSIRDLITQAMEQYHNKTCIRFVKRDNQKDYITLYKGNGCSSFIGRQGGNQRVNLGQGCGYVGTIVHELGHAVGLYHEHQRTDRDDYITVYLNNVESGQESNFERTSPEAELNLTSFNYNSIMIYGEYAFSRDPDNLKTMTAKSASVQLADPYDKPGLDNTDITEVNKLYECNL